MRSRWYHPPTLHTASSGEKKAGWLELFYDLVFVAAFIRLGDGLAQHWSLEGFVAFSAVFVPIWLAWVGFSYYANRFNIDDFTHRALVFGQMFAVGAMAIYAPDVLNGRPERFALSFAVAQGVVAGLYFRAWKHHEARDYSVYWGGVFAFGAVLWAVSVLCPPPVAYLLWAIAIGGILSSPIGRRSRTLEERYPIDHEHLSERFGLLTLIVLGESFVKVISNISPEMADLHVLGQAALTLLITCSLWWIYFDDVAGSRLKATRFSGVLWLFGHIPTQLGITAAGVAMKKAAIFDLGEPAPAKVRWLLCGALGIAMLGVALIDSVTARKQAEMADKARVNMRMTSALVILLMAQVGGAMPGWLFLGIVTVMCLAQVIFDLMMAPMAEEGHHQENHLVADAARAAIAEGRRVKAPDVRRLKEVVRKGTPSELRRDLYFYLMEGPWFRVVASLGFLYLLANVVFAALYTLEPGCITNARTDSFADAFFFSVQTMSTIGYGHLSPATPYGNLIVTLQAGLCLIMVALATGLMFAKASRPRASVMFSESIVLTTRYGKPTLMFRVGNARGNEIVDANLLVSVLCDEMTPEGDHMRRLYDLKLERSRQPFFTMTWSVMHTIDEESCLHGVDWSDVDGAFISIVAILTGHDGTYGQTVFARHNYTPPDLRVGHRFVDVISQLPDGRMVIDYERFHDTAPEVRA